MFKKILKWIGIAILTFVISSVLSVVILKFIPPPVTPPMIFRVIEGLFEGRSIGISKQWVSFDEISPNFFRAVISGEDARFMSHSGFDWKAIERAKKFNETQKGKRKRGASTISMQTAKNTFLCHSRNYIRKAFEAYFTVLIEAIWGKKRIMEMYSNVIEFGEGIYGVEQASQTFFSKSAKNLTKREAALLAAVLPNPRIWSPAKPTNYIEIRANFIQSRMSSVPIPK